MPNFTPHRCNVSPLQGVKPQNRPLSNLNTGKLALRAMLPVKTKREILEKIRKFVKLDLGLLVFTVDELIQRLLVVLLLHLPITVVYKWQHFNKPTFTNAVE